MIYAPGQVVREIIRKHQVFFVDLFGVLKTNQGPIPGTAETIREIKEQGKRVIIVSNTASDPPEDIQGYLKQRGVEFELRDVVTSGMVLEPYFRTSHLVGSNVFNLGNPEGANYIQKAGGIVLDHQVVLASPEEVAAVVVTRHALTRTNNELLPTALINAAINILKYGSGVHGVIANPDLTVPQDENSVRIGPGALGAIIEQCAGKIMAKLGKPYAPIFELALSLVPEVPKEQIVMVGDSLEYDVLGASMIGIHSLLVMSGNTRTEAQITAYPVRPDYIAAAFCLNC